MTEKEKESMLNFLADNDVTIQCVQFNSLVLCKTCPLREKCDELFAVIDEQTPKLPCTEAVQYAICCAKDIIKLRKETIRDLERRKEYFNDCGGN